MVAADLPAPTTTQRPAGLGGRWAASTAAGSAARTAAANRPVSACRAAVSSHPMAGTMANPVPRRHIGFGRRTRP